MLPLVVGVLFCCALLSVLSSFAIILKRKRDLVALLLLSNGCHVTVNVLWLFIFLFTCDVNRSANVLCDLSHIPKHE